MTEGIELPNQDKIRNLGEKKTYKYQGILEADAINVAEMKNKIPQEKKKTIRNETAMQKSHQRDKYLSCPPRNILGTILEVNQTRTPTNGPENKKIHDDT